MTQTEIWTERLLLRAAEERDLPAFKKFLWDPEAMKYWSMAAHTDIEQTKQVLNNMINSPYNGVLDFVVCLPDPGNNDISSGGSDESAIPIGKAGLWNGKEIGFIFDREHWGKGYAFEALDAVVKQFWTTNENEDATIKADVDPRNKRSLRLLGKLGFVEIGRAKNTFETHIGCTGLCNDIKPDVQLEHEAQFKVLYDEELLDHIFAFFDDCAFYCDMSISRLGTPLSQHLVWASLACKAFFNSAMRVLWATMDSWEILLNLIPQSVLKNEEGMYVEMDVILDQHLDRLASYTRHIRQLRIPIEVPPVSSYAVYVSIARLRPRLFPALQNLAVTFRRSQTEHRLGVFLLTPSPSLMRVEIINFTPSAEIQSASFLRDIYAQSPKLAKLVLWDISGQSLLRSATQFSHLEALELGFQGADLSSHFFVALSEMKMLKSLSLTVDRDRDLDRPESTFTRFAGPVATFELLETLVIGGAPRIVLEILQMIRTPELDVAIVTFREDVENITERCFERVITMAPSLRKIRSLTPYDVGRVPTSVLPLLRSCPRLEDVDLAMRHLTLEVLRCICINPRGSVGPWNELRVLNLTGTWISPIEDQLWISSLHLFAPVCPNLKELVLSIVLAKDPECTLVMKELVKNPMRPCHPLESLELIYFDNIQECVIEHFSMEDGVVISRYIDHIFPHIDLEKFVFMPCQAEPAWSFGVTKMVAGLKAARNSEREHECHRKY